MNAAQRKADLKSKTKKEVFDIFCRRCLGRIHNARCVEQDKSFMVEDILHVEFRNYIG